MTDTPSRRPHGAVPRARHLLAVVTLGVVAVPAAAEADVLRITQRGDHVSVTALGPVGPRVLTQQHLPATDEPGLWSASPDGRHLAFESYSRTVVLSLSGGRSPITVAAAPPRAVPARLWWLPDGSEYVVGPSKEPTSGRQVVRRCPLPLGTPCTTQNLGTAAPIGTTSDGGLLVTDGDRDLGRFFREDDAQWRERPRAWASRVRRLLDRPRPQRVWVLAPDGRASRPLLGGRATPSHGLADLHVTAGDTTSGPLLTRQRGPRLRLETRARRGRLQARVVVRPPRSGAVEQWRLEPGGRLVAVPRLRARRFVPSVPLADGSWLGERFVGTAKDLVRTRMVPALGRPDGSGRDLTVGGQVVTPRRLYAALALPPGDAPAPADPTLRLASSVLLVGLERSTRSAVVRFTDRRERDVVARVPLDGGAPTALDRGPEPAHGEASATAADTAYVAW